MCRKIVINRGEINIETPKEFKKHFGFYPITEEDFNEPDLVGCMCPVYIAKTLKTHNIPYKMCGGDYYVGQLELVIEA